MELIPFYGHNGTPVPIFLGVFSVFSLAKDFAKGELDPVVKRKVSNMAAEANELNLNNRYSRALKDCNDINSF